ncbi:MAG TPA: LacI family DNA-binding transcriptional regulator [Spirochaetia bacterium]|nr:LacI family DNA-binding transcriptional regulator [Spirochaetia bacterium]
MRKQRRATLEDVAQRAGVSKATASVVLNDRVGRNIRANPKTQQRVLDAARELGYVANSAARILAGQQNRIIAIFTYEPIFPVEFRDYFYPFLLGIEAEAERQGYDLLLMTSTGEANRGRSIFAGGENRLRIADGVVLMGLRRDSEEIRRLLLEEIPVVFIGRREFEGFDTSYVASDYAQATELLTRVVAGRGHRSIAYVGLPAVAESAIDRERGFLDAVGALGLEPSRCPVIRRDTEQITPEYLDALLARQITAFVVENYYFAARLKVVGELLGKSLPNDYSVAILDGPGDEVAPTLNWTRFVQQRHELGMLALRTLVEILQGRAEPPVRKIIECEIVEGTTVGERLS